MIFEYSVTKTFNESIDIVDFGNTAIRCSKKDCLDYYIIVKTVMGKTSILKFGPIIPDVPVLAEDFTVSYKKMDYKENSIFKEIDKYINDFRKEIDSVEEITEFEAWQAFPNVQQNFENIWGNF